MKLELKHLAAYLPYGLKIYTGDIEDATTIGIDGERVHLGVYGYKTPNSDEIFYRPDIWHNISVIGKPILKPLTSLELEKVIDNNTYWNHLFAVSRGLEKCSWDKLCTDIECCNTFTLPYSVIEKLCSWHFDVFGLIPAGLAIDINTI